MVADDSARQLVLTRSQTFLRAFRERASHSGDTPRGWRRRQNRPVARLREQFSAADTDGSGTLSLEEVQDFLLVVCELHNIELDEAMKELLSCSSRLWFDTMMIDLQDTHSLSEEEWVHGMMIKATAPSHVAAELLTRRWRRAAQSCQTSISQTLEFFAAADTDQDGTLSREEWPAAVNSLGVSCADFVDYNGDGVLDYFEFASFAVGAEPLTVELAMYDISSGIAQWIPSFLLSGHKFDGIWHTGVLVFGKEYWYGGGVFESFIGKTPFGKPQRVVSLGKTLRSQRELLRYISDELRWEYTPGAYDVFTHNCNCFSNEVVKFLLNDFEIPEEVRLQPKWAASGFGVKLLRPLLNRKLGQFGSEAGSFCYHNIDDLTDEWRERVLVGDVVLHRAHFADSPQVARVECVQGDSNEFRDNVDLVMLVLKDDPDSEHHISVSVRHLRDVPRTHLFPLRSTRGVGAAKLLVEDVECDEVESILRRSTPRLAQPICPRGHILSAAPDRMFSWQRSPCSLCSRVAAGATAGCCVQRHGDVGEWLTSPGGDFMLCPECAVEGRQIHAFVDILNMEVAKNLLKKERWLKYKAEWYYNRADYNWSDDLDEEELASLLERVSWELGSSFQGTTAEDIAGAGSVNKESFLKFFRDLLQRTVTEFEGVGHAPR
eukprot:TRINITY_DN37516_c1_g1_i1.p1 TRINITY_DN37516_c1_g1~~TRINITY_DN37516_c1_g1_i1.p1  ORF type:complete len:661 (+),score=83.24 TRINITY_DN37516_c1_g1_i1:72-2054(+)